MIAAMAPLLLIREIGRLWSSSLRRTRYLTVISFVIGYVAIWLLAGEAVSTLLGLTTITTGHIVLTAALTVLWHLSPARQRRLNACHRVPPLRMFGVSAQWDAIRYGVRSGGNCVAACFLVMLLAFMIPSNHFAIMAVAAVVMTVERYLPARRARWRLGVPRRRSLDWPDLDVAIA
jgi:predicted metal-binding membrane protein